MNKDSLFVYEEDGFCELKYTFKDLKRLERKNKNLQNNWNELKNYLILCSNFGTKKETYQYEHILNKMTELERGEE